MEAPTALSVFFSLLVLNALRWLLVRSRSGFVHQQRARLSREIQALRRQAEVGVQLSSCCCAAHNKPPCCCAEHAGHAKTPYIAHLTPIRLCSPRHNAGHVLLSLMLPDCCRV